MFEKENTVFTDSKDRQVKHYYPIKKAVTLRIGSGLKEFLRVQEISNLSLSTWNLYLREIIFVTNIGVLAIETFLIEKPVSTRALSLWNSFGSFISWNPWISYCEAFEIRENGTPAKKVTLRDAKDCRDKICIEVETTSDNAGGQPKRDFSLQHKTFSALSYAQDFETIVGIA